jgi:hypothetical protein
MPDQLRTTTGAELHRVTRGFGTGRARVETLLVILSAPRPVPVGTVAAVVGVTPSLASGHCSALATAGLVVGEKVPCRGGRRVEYQGTAFGRRVVLALLGIDPAQLDQPAQVGP